MECFRTKICIDPLNEAENDEGSNVVYYRLDIVAGKDGRVLAAGDFVNARMLPAPWALRDWSFVSRYLFERRTLLVQSEGCR